MAGDQLRGLERRYRQTGSQDDLRAWLSARLRVGELGEERLRLAVFCGDAAARRVAEDAGVATDGGQERVGGRDALRRCGLAVARGALPVLRSEGGALEDDARGAGVRRDELLVEVGEALLLSEGSSDPEPLDPHGAARTRLLAIGSLQPDDVVDPFAGFRRELDAAEVRLAQRVLFLHERGRGKRHAAATLAWLHGTFWPFRSSADALTAALEQARSVWAAPWWRRHAPSLPAELEAVLAAEVTPWALGLGDPVRERIAMSAEVEVPPSDVGP